MTSLAAAESSPHVSRAQSVGLSDLDSARYYSSGFTLYAVSSLMANPFLLVKRRQQLGMSGGLTRVVSSEGVRSLFRGGTLCWVSGINRMGYFTVYEHVTSALEKMYQNVSPSKHHKGDPTIAVGTQSLSTGIAAAVASVTSQLVLTPFSVITTRLHINTGPPVSSLTVLTSTLRSHGGWGILWTGYISALLQSIPHNLVMFSVYNFAKAYMGSWGFMSTPESDVASRLLCSVGGSYAAILVTSPIDITRTHRQAMISSLSQDIVADSVTVTGVTGGSMQRIPSSWVVLKDIYNKFGVKYMYRGSTARLMSSTPYTVAMLIGYDYIKLFAATSTADL